VLNEVRRIGRERYISGSSFLSAPEYESRPKRFEEVQHLDKNNRKAIPKSLIEGSSPWHGDALLKMN
jgi:hypothetical protein